MPSLYYGGNFHEKEGETLAFQGNKFIFDGIPGEQYGLMLANVNNASQKAGQIGGVWKVHEDRIARRSVGLDYGVTANEPLSFPITMVAMEDNHHFDRYEVAAIAGWLTGHQEFKKLVVLQPDMENVYYRCRITKLETVDVGMRIIGFTATVTCDSPYAYRSANCLSIEVNGGDNDFVVFNHSNVNDYFYPTLTLNNLAHDVTIINHSDNDNVFRLSGLPAPDEGTPRNVTIDCLHQVMASSDGINLYEHWNIDEPKYFPRFVRGENRCTISKRRSLRYVPGTDASAYYFECDDDPLLRTAHSASLHFSIINADGSYSLGTRVYLRPFGGRIPTRFEVSGQSYPIDQIDRVTLTVQSSADNASVDFAQWPYCDKNGVGCTCGLSGTLEISGDVYWNIGY